ncbi:MAG: hypothetical protein GQ553_01840 [Nitrosomonadaceae bacterium]|nr:hypothetical protein [Nitrosomonadaceae bacterium]
MDIYQNDSTGITTPQGRQCNEFFFDIKTDNRENKYTVMVSLYEREDDAIALLTPNFIRELEFETTTETTLEDCITNVFANNPYDLGDVVLDLSDATVIASVNGIS